MNIQIWCTISLILLVATITNGAALQFADMISRTTRLNAGDLRGYANYCGFRGKGTPIDNLDRCCQAHDQCLSRVNRSSCFPLLYVSFYIIPYRYMFVNNSVVCNSGNSNCQKSLCECDRVAAECFRTYQDEYNRSLKKG